MPMKKYDSVEEYLESLTSQTKSSILELKGYILEAVPKAKEIFKGHHILYSLIEGTKRDQQIMVSGYAKHTGFYPHPGVITMFEQDLQDYKYRKGTVQFPNDKPLPKELIIKMVKSMKEVVAEM
jgi:uncharacterized protein YdhG (YjbR/CyaY superfamily)